MWLVPRYLKIADRNRNVKLIKYSRFYVQTLIAKVDDLLNSRTFSFVDKIVKNNTWDN